MVQFIITVSLFLNSVYFHVTRAILMVFYLIKSWPFRNCPLIQGFQLFCVPLIRGSTVLSAIAHTQTIKSASAFAPVQFFQIATMLICVNSNVQYCNLIYFRIKKLEICRRETVT